MFESSVDVRHHVSIEPQSGHHLKPPAIDHAHVNPPGLAGRDGPRDGGHVPGQIDLGGEDIGGSQRNDRQWQVTAGQTSGHFVDGAIAAGRDHHVEILVRGGGREGLRLAAARRFADCFLHSQPRKGLTNARQPSTRKVTGNRIVDDQGAAAK